MPKRPPKSHKPKQGRSMVSGVVAGPSSKKPPKATPKKKGY